MLGWIHNRMSRKPVCLDKKLHGERMTPNSTSDRPAERRPPTLARPKTAVYAVLAMAFLAILGIAGAGLWLRYDDVLRDGRHNAGTLTGILSEHLDIQIDAIEEALLAIADYSRLVGGPNASGMEWMSALNTVAAGRPGIEAFMVTDADGRTAFSSIPLLMGESRADGRAFRELSANPASDALIADTPVRSTNDSKFVVPLARVLRTPDTQFEGLAIATFQPDQLRAFYDGIDTGANGIVWLLKAPDLVLLRQPRLDKPADQAMPLIPIAMSGTDSARGTHTGPLESGGADYITAYHTVEGVGLTVAVSLAVDELLAAWWNELYAVTALVFVAGLFLLFAAFVVSHALRAKAS